MTIHDRLQDLAHNLRWDWHPPTRRLFESLDPELWERVDHNPVALIRRLDPDAVNDRADLAARATALHEELEGYLAADRVWYEGNRAPEAPLAAYFSAEFGLTECLRIYSGGLGILAGDHLKSASDLGVPLVAVGLLYREGYFRQGVDEHGRQTESFPAADFDDLPVRPVTDRGGWPLRVSVPFPGRRVGARVWRADVGRVPLFLLDTDVPENDPGDRRLTARLYAGGSELRIAQEILLGVGGYRALAAMAIEPKAYHMNEGHSAFLALELVRDLMQQEGLPFQQAAARARARCVFTTHTPVPAGHDRFGRKLVARYLTDTAHSLGLDLERLLDLGRAAPGTDDPFTMTVLAIRLSAQTNGVSELHGAVSRSMWHALWPDRRVEDVPIGHITNGIHIPTWVHPEVLEGWDVDRDALVDASIHPAPDLVRLWRTREVRRKALVDYVARKVGAELDPRALTIAFARRFATYKRATLLLGDLDRLHDLTGNPERPVQIVFAGKAHPDDEGGKALIRQIGEVSRDPRFRNRIVFLPDYSIDVGRALVQGADVWLNNPRRPMEASGTSGMKAAMNGVLNVSILDGWWDEAWRNRDPEAPPPGWRIGEGLDRPSREAADRADTEALFHVLADEVVPAFYDRGADQLPHAWLARMEQSIRQVAPVFNTHRMVADYVIRYRAAADCAPGQEPAERVSA
ncbi:MAG: alpha-glucan family phosphorylase [Gemmatimonadota bacterium]